MNKTKIAWTERTWNPVTGCTKISEGCRHCYAETMAKRLQGMGQKRYKNGFTLTLHPEALNEPKKVNGCLIDGKVCQEWPKILYDNPIHTELVKHLAKIDSMPKNNYYKMKGGRQ